MKIGIRTAGVVLLVVAWLICHTADPRERPDGTFAHGSEKHLGGIGDE